MLASLFHDCIQGGGAGLRATVGPNAKVRLQDIIVQPCVCHRWQARAFGLGPQQQLALEDKSSSNGIVLFPSLCQPMELGPRNLANHLATPGSMISHSATSQQSFWATTFCRTDFLLLRHSSMNGI